VQKTIRSLLVILGNILYHFDRALFGLLTPFLAPHFFPTFDPIYALISMYAIAPLTVFVKPLGALFFGSLGDRIGKRRVLSFTLMGMALKTFLMGCLPTYHQVGAFAPLFLAFTRLAISFFSGGETTGGAIFLLERCKTEKRSLISSLFDASGILGIVIASTAIALFCSYEGFWRYLFWAGGLIGLIGWVFRRLPEDVEHVHTEQIQSSWSILWEYRQVVVAVSTLAGFSYANYYLITHFMNGFIPLISGITQAEAMVLNSKLLLFDLILLPLFGIVSLKVSKEVLIRVAIVGILVVAFPLFLLLGNVTLFKLVFVRIVLTILGVSLAAPYHAWVFEVTPLKHRYLIGAFSTAIGARLFGAPLPCISLWLFKQTGMMISPVFPLMIVGVLALVSFQKLMTQRVDTIDP
jgi:MFS transporter, MHS family, proline/betaine transporter